MTVNQETDLIPIFPLDIVLFPGNQLNLHIFEEKYKSMIQHVLDSEIGRAHV